jgi:MFS family permease
MANAVSNATNTREGVSVGTEDVTGVRSRVSWPAVLAGSVLALALYFLLTLLGSAIGFSISDKFEGRNIGIGAAVFAIVVTAGCLFAGGFVASQLTAGENKREGAMYGLFVWAAVFTMLLWLMATGVKAGFNTMVGVATAGGHGAPADSDPGEVVSQFARERVRSRYR